MGLRTAGNESAPSKQAAGLWWIPLVGVPHTYTSDASHSTAVINCDGNSVPTLINTRVVYF